MLWSSTYIKKFFVKIGEICLSFVGFIWSNPYASPEMIPVLVLFAIFRGLFFSFSKYTRTLFEDSSCYFGSPLDPKVSILVAASCLPLMTELVNCEHENPRLVSLLFQSTWTSKQKTINCVPKFLSIISLWLALQNMVHIGVASFGMFIMKCHHNFVYLVIMSTFGRLLQALEVWITRIKFILDIAS